MTHSSRRFRSARSSRKRHSGQVLLVAVLLMIVIAVLGSTFAAVVFSAQVRPTSLVPSADHQIIARADLWPRPASA